VKALLVVDMQNDFCHPDGNMYAEGSENVIPKVNRAICNFDTVIYTMDTHEEGDPEFEKWGEHCIRNSWGHRVHNEIKRVYPSTILQKSAYDAFFDTNLHDILQDKTRGISLPEKVDEIYICGTLANVCVQETASSANLHGYEVSVVEDAVGYISKEQRDAALKHIDFLIGDLVEVNDL